MSDIWQKLTSDKFWASGSLFYYSPGQRFVFNSLMKVAGWDTTSSFINKSYIYTPDEDSYYHLDTLLFKPCARQCITNYLDQDEVKFVTDAFHKAYIEMRKHCGSEYFVSTMLLAKAQNNFLPMHKHAVAHQPTFTYVISSNHSKPNTDILVETKDNQTLTLNYPDAKEFFTLIDTGLMHGTQTQSDDNNYYLYFVFDGVTVTNPSLEFHKIYIV
jgi:hypothetical protein